MLLTEVILRLLVITDLHRLSTAPCSCFLVCSLVCLFQLFGFVDAVIVLMLICMRMFCFVGCLRGDVCEVMFVMRFEHLQQYMCV